MLRGAVVVTGLLCLGACLGVPDAGEPGGDAGADGADAAPGCVSSLAVGGSHACATTAAGLLCWGNNGTAQVGLGSPDPAAVAIPTPPAELATGATLALGGFHSCALEGGALTCVGADYFGQLGDVQTAGHTPTAVEVPLDDVAQADAGDEYSCAVTGGGRLSCWGLNDDGQLGDGTTERRNLPTEVVGLTDVVEVATGARHTCARTATGVTCWGANAEGQLGLGTRDAALTPTEVPGLTDAVELGVGLLHACARMADRTVRCWGANQSGEVGDGSGLANQASPVAVPTLDAVDQLAIGYQHSCALQEGRVYCWGLNASGQVSPDLASALFGPVPVFDGAIAIGAGRHDTCALATDGQVHCWGANDVGQLGAGVVDAEVTRSTPALCP